ncbi:MAG TPA: tripartite tricarboxylate transporter substrate-binding protein [Burkholderiales bacterium]|nr:tripartite tricarboxylate transporter substrate-binding protein [Burkholderiales bacterium]
MKTLCRLFAWFAFLLFPCAFLLQAVALAADYPSRPIRVLIPFAPGGATDIIARMIEPKMSRSLGQQLVVDNRPGAAGNIAVELAAQAQPDGYTLLMGNISTNSINPILFADKMKVSAVRDLTGITQLVAIPNFILGSPKIPATTLKEAMEYAKSRPGQLNFGAPLGSYAHLDMLALTARAGVRMVHLPTKGAGETLANLLRGDSHIQVSNVASNIGAVRAGQIRAYAVTSEKRLEELPGVPTMAEAGFPGIGSLNWNGLFAPARTPKPVLARLHAAAVAAMKELEAEGVLAKRMTPIALSASPEAFNAYVLSEMRRWEGIIRENMVRIE